MTLRFLTQWRLVYTQERRKFLMLGIRVCATDQRRFFTFRNPEQAPNFEAIFPEQALTFKVQMKCFFYCRI